MTFVNEGNREEFLETIGRERMFIFPVLSFPEKHFCENRISFVYFATISLEREFLVNCYNYDVPSSELNLGQIRAKQGDICYKKKFCESFENSTDADILHWYFEGEPIPIPDSPCIDFHRRNGLNNDLVPIYKWLEIIHPIRDSVINLDPGKAVEYDNLINQLTKVEKNGLCVSVRDVFSGGFGENLRNAGLIFSEYNPYTSTGRPSNHFNGINFAALNKSTGIRRNFISRFEKGWLIEFDYRAYHIQLIAKLLGYQFPEEDIYRFLAKEYFGSDPTEEQIHQAKEFTFQQIYGGIRPEFRHIEFFQLLQKLLDRIHAENAMGTCKSFLFKRPFKSTDNSIKTFNYLLQNLETEINSVILEGINDFLKDKASKIILYTYDSFLFDYSPDDGIAIIKELKSILEKTGIRTKLRIGRNYQEMIEKTI